MTFKEFEKLLDLRIMKTREVLAAKNREYASDTDKLYNFKRAAAMLGCSDEEALLGMLAKHLVSIIDMVQNKREAIYPLWDEKIGDAINYLILLEAIVVEKNNE